MKAKEISEKVGELSKDYLKCVWANKVTLMGYLTLGGYFLTKYYGPAKSAELEPIRDALMNSCDNLSRLFLIITIGGLETFRTYRKTKTYIKEFGKIKDSYQTIKNTFYCSRVAIHLAAKEAGLEHLLKKGDEK